MKTKRFLSLLLALALMCGMLPGAVVTAHAAEADSYTYNDYTAALATNWNPHAWTSNGESQAAVYLTTPLVEAVIKDSSIGEYQWAYLAAESITDVTADHLDDLGKYGSDLGGVEVSDISSGFVYEIQLNPDMKWQDGTPINADTYIYSMDRLLCPEMRNLRANNYIYGVSAIAGAEEYYYSGTTAWLDAMSTIRISDLVADSDGVYAMADGTEVKFALTTGLEWLSGNSLRDCVDTYGEAYFGMDAWQPLLDLMDENGNVAVTDTSIGLMEQLITTVPSWGEGPDNVAEYLIYGKTYPKTTYDASVGLYKVDDYTIRYVCKTAYEYNYFLTSCTSNWLVYEDLYEAGKYIDPETGLTATNYCTSVATTMSYGPYMFESITPDKQFVLVQNPNHFEYQSDGNGGLTSTTGFLVDGKKVPQYQTTRIVIDVMMDETAKYAFKYGDLDIWIPSADELLDYTTSGRMYQVDESFTMRMIFNSNPDMLKTMDADHGNQNSVVMSSHSFRKAMSLALDREVLANATSGYKPALGLLNNLYYTDVYNDPASVYRYTDQAQAAMCELYDVDYTAATLDQAYASLTGYDLTKAKKLMAQACNELTSDGLYTKGEDILINIAISDTTPNRNLVKLMNQQLNAAAAGSGFGTITLKIAENVENNYTAISNGDVAIAFGGWGGAAFYPFMMMRLYCDPDYMGVYEGHCYDPANEELTLTIGGKSYTKTWQEWSRSTTGTGAFADASLEIRTEILAKLESAFLSQYYCIPLFSTATSYLLGKQVDYYTDEYNTMYGFGGIRLMRYNYSDAEWEAYVTSGKLDYGTPEALAITTQPSGKTVKAGTAVKFTVKATGSDLRYQWQYRTSSSGTWKKATATGNQTATLSMKATVARHGYQYRCIITDGSGNKVTSKAVTLNVLGIKTQPVTQKVKAGTVKFTVKAVGKGLTYQWQYKNAKGNWVNATGTGNKTATLTVKATTALSGRQYHCVIKDSAGNTVYTNTVYLYVLGVKTQPVSRNVKAGTSVKFTVAASGHNKTYQWQYKNANGKWVNATGTGNKTATLTVRAAAALSGRQYRCVIKDSAGNTVYSNTVTLTVLGIKTQPVSKAVAKGAAAKFSVVATGSGLTYQWQYLNANGKWVNATAAGAKTRTLTVKATAALNGRQYRCRITDSRGWIIYSNVVKLKLK